jgi:phosphotransferase system HPr (HPr) family protein
VKRAQVTIRWEAGLHLRPTTRLVKLAQTFHSTIRLKTSGKTANARSILAVLLLCASFGTVLELEVSGDDEDETLPAIQAVFDASDDLPDSGSEAAPHSPQKPV